MDEVDELRREVTALRRKVDALVDLLLQVDGFGSLDRRQVERRLAAATRSALEDAEPEDASVSAALGQSAYRGAAPASHGGLACAICRKALAEDDPELTLKNRARVCLACFHRGSAP